MFTAVFPCQLSLYQYSKLKTMNSMMKAKSTLKKYKICVAMTTWLLVFGARVSRQAGKKGSSMHAQPSVFYLFHKRPQQMKLCTHPLHCECVQNRYNMAWVFQCEPSTNHALPTAATYSAQCSANNLSDSYNIPYFLPLKTHFFSPLTNVPKNHPAFYTGRSKAIKSSKIPC
jgi:hypothetical protein